MHPLQTHSMPAQPMQVSLPPQALLKPRQQQQQQRRHQQRRHQQQQLWQCLSRQLKRRSLIRSPAFVASLTTMEAQFSAKNVTAGNTTSVTTPISQLQPCQMPTLGTGVQTANPDHLIDPAPSSVCRLGSPIEPQSEWNAKLSTASRQQSKEHQPRTQRRSQGQSTSRPMAAERLASTAALAKLQRLRPRGQRYRTVPRSRSLHSLQSAVRPVAAREANKRHLVRHKHPRISLSTFIYTATRPVSSPCTSSHSYRLCTATRLLVSASQTKCLYGFASPSS